MHLAYAEVFIINENGMIIAFEHCKSKAFSDIAPALERIWTAQDPTVDTEVLWTDNVRGDKNALEQLYKKKKPGKSILIGQV